MNVSALEALKSPSLTVSAKAAPMEAAVQNTTPVHISGLRLSERPLKKRNKKGVIA